MKKDRGKEAKRRVALVGNFLQGKGLTPQVCERLRADFKAKEWEVLAVSDRMTKAARLSDMVFSLLRFRDRYDFLIIDTFSGSAFWFAAGAAKIASFLKKPYVLILHGGNLPEFFKKNDSTIGAAMHRLLFPHPLFHRATVINYRPVLEQAAAIVTPSPYLAKAMGAMGFPAIEIPNSLEIRRYDFTARSSLSPKLFWLRSISHIYNPLLAIEVLANLKKRYPGACLTMAGPDRGALEECRLKAAELHLLDSVTFPGLIDKNEINRLGQIHDIFINPTNIDNTPVSVVEAMAMGLPVVSTNVGGMPFLIEDGVNGLLVDPGDAGTMTHAVIRLLNDKNLAGQCSVNARKKALCFSWENVYPLWEKLAEDILGKG